MINMYYVHYELSKYLLWNRLIFGGAWRNFLT